MDTPPPRDPLLAAEDLLGDLAARAAEGQRADFDSLVRAHPSLEAELRALHGAGAEVDADLDKARSALAAEQAHVDAILAQLGGESATSPGRRYVLEGEVGKGGMGVVYRVRDTKLDRHLAMKVILGQADATRSGKTPPIEARRLVRFVNEAKITGQLDHPGIVPVHEVGVDEQGRAYFTMKLVKGITLEQVFRQRAAGDPRWTMPRVLEVIARVCEALAFAHEREVIHRDLKPQNVMVGDFGEVYVMDWGLARRLGDVEEARAANAEVDARLEEQLSLTRDGSIVGTPSYMSPEQARGEIAELDARADVYAVGAMLYELLAGHAPYVRPGERASGAEVLARVITAKPAAITAREAPPELVAICERAMQRERAARYADLRELGDELGRFLSGRTVRAFETGAWAETKKWVQRNKALSGSVGAALIVVSVLALYAQGQAVEAKEQAQRAEVGERDAREQSARAERGESEARRNAETAQRNAEAAQLARDEATQKANDVLSLSAQKDLDDLVAQADRLWPAHPEMIGDYEDWMRRANELIDGRPEAPGQKKRPSLAEHKAKLAEMRREAKPLSEAEVRAERESHSKYAELQTKEAELLWRSRMLGTEAWPSEAALEVELAKESLPTDADALNALAWPLVYPAMPVYGQEVRALLLARRAVAVASEEKRSGMRDTLAWSLFRLGRFGEALSEERSALSAPGGEALKPSAAELEMAVALWRGEELPKRHAERDALAAEVAGLEAQVSARRTYEYEDAEKAWWDRSLSKLVGDLEKLRDPETGLMNDVLAEPFGWGVAKRYEFAKTIGRRSVGGPEANRLWSEAIEAIRRLPRYGGLAIESQLGLLPIGMDVDSGLWEFAHLQTGDAAVRGADGKLVLTEQTGLVFVLIPGGSCWLGAQSVDPNAENFDERSLLSEGPTSRGTLSPFLVSKFETTQGQWRRIMAVNASRMSPNSPLSPVLISFNDEEAAFGDLHPAENISYYDIQAFCRATALLIPTHTEWEYMARAHTNSPWWTGDAESQVSRGGNIADADARIRARQLIPTWSYSDSVHDGSAFVCRIGKYDSNPFGIHDTIGNVFEWCRDETEAIQEPRQAQPVSAGRRSAGARGGSWFSVCDAARVTYRLELDPAFRFEIVGFRPAIRLK